MKLKTKFILPLSSLLILGAIAMMAWIYYSSYRNTLQQANRDSAVLADAIHDAVYGLMQSGQQLHLEAYLEEALKSKEVREIRVIRSDALEKDKGVREGTRATDDLDRKVLRSGRGISMEVTVKQGKAIRHIEPILAIKSCRACHTSLKEGEVMAALSTTLVFQSTLDQMKRNLIRAGLLQSVLILFILAIIFMMFNKLIMKPLTTMGAFVRKMGSGDLTATMDMKQGGKRMLLSSIDPRDEIGELAAAFNKMSLNLQASSEKLHQEIKEHKRAVETEEETQKLLNILINSISEVFYVFDADGKFILWNEAFKKVTGYSQEEIPKMRPTDFFDEKGAVHIAESIKEAFEKGSASAEESFLTKDGRKIPLLFSGSIAKGFSGRPILCGIGKDITELRRAEEARLEGMAQYLELFENMQSAFALHEIITDKSGAPVDYIFLKANPAFEKILGLSQDDYIGKRVTQVFPGVENDPANWIGRYGKIALEGGAASFEDYSPALNKWFSVAAYQPKTGQFVAVFTDVTARKNAEKGLQLSQEYLARIIDTIADPIFVKDAEHRWVLLNKAFCAFMGHTAEELLGKSDYDFFPKEEADVFRKKDSEVFQSGTENVNEEFFTDGTGVRRTIITKKTIYKDPEGRDQLVGIIRDITELRCAVQAAEREQILINAMINSIPGAFYVLDENGRYVRWNTYQRDEIVGKPEDQVASTNAAETIHPDDRAFIQSKIASVLGTGGQETVEGRVLLRGGPEFKWLLMTGQQMLIDGKPFLVGVGFDITERKKFEQEAKKRLQELEIFYKASVGREERILELKKEITQLKRQQER